MSCAGERLEDSEVDLILKLTDTQEDLDGNIKYEGTSTSIPLRCCLWLSVNVTLIR